MTHQSHYWHISREKHNSKRYMHPNVYCSTFTIARTSKQPKCPLAEEWIKKMWYVCTHTHTHTHNGLLLIHKKEQNCPHFLIPASMVFPEFPSVTHLDMSDSLWPHRLQPIRLLCPQDFPGKNTGMGCHFFLEGIFPIQESNPGLPHVRQILYHLSHQGSPWVPKGRFKELLIWE